MKDHYFDVADLLCRNCLNVGAALVPLGHDQGTQRDPYRVEVPLCHPCRSALLAGDFAAVASMNVTERTVSAPANPRSDETATLGE